MIWPSSAELLGMWKRLSYICELPKRPWPTGMAIFSGEGCSAIGINDLVCSFFILLSMRARCVQ